MPEISIIVPVYKVEEYLCKCIDSILAQTLTDFELILIDDGSPDGCGAICDAYAAKDSRIVVIHQKNAGVSAARNAGLEIARGAYIGFVDSDDWIEPEMYETMLRKAKETQADVVVCGIQYAETDGRIISTACKGSNQYTNQDLIKALFEMPCEIGGGVWNKIFLATAVKEARFPEDRKIGEDCIYLFYALKTCRSGVKLTDVFYTLLERSGSATRDGRIISMCDALLGSKLLLLLLCRKYTPELEKYAIDKYMDDCLRYVPKIKEAGKKQRQPYRATVWKIKWRMAKAVFRAWRLRLLPKAKLHGYVFEWIKL